MGFRHQVQHTQMEFKGHNARIEGGSYLKIAPSSLKCHVHFILLAFLTWQQTAKLFLLYQHGWSILEISGLI